MTTKASKLCRPTGAEHLFLPFGRLSIFTKMKDVFWLCPLTLGGFKQHLGSNVI